LCVGSDSDSSNSQATTNVTHTEDRSKLKLILLGESGVGKSCLLQQYVHGSMLSWNVATIGVDFQTKDVLVEGSKYQAQIWDTAGQEKFRVITRSYYHNTQVFILVFDLTKKTTFANLDYWISEISKQAESPSIVLVGNKSDLEGREVSLEEMKQFSTSNGILFHTDASAFNGNNVDLFFKFAVEESVKVSKIQFEQKQQQ